MEIEEIIRQWQAGRGIRSIAHSTGISRNTIRKYLLTAQSSGLVRSGPPPTDLQLTALMQLNQVGPQKIVSPTDKVLEPYSSQVEQWIKHDHLQLVRIQELLAQRQCIVAYTCLRRYVRKKGWFGKNTQSTVRTGHSVRFVRADNFFKTLAQGRVDHTLEKTMRSFLNPDLLVLDDFGLQKLTAQQSTDLYELIIARHRQSSFAFTSNRAVDEWLGLFDDPILGNSALDRLANAQLPDYHRGGQLPREIVATSAEGGIEKYRQKVVII